MRILIPNIGSTSLKYRLFQFGPEERPRCLARGSLERVEDHRQAVDRCLEELRQAGHLEGDGGLAAVGFKTVLAHGATGCVRLDPPVIEAIERAVPAAPAHNPPYLEGIRIFRERLPGVPLVALFETAFYQWMPEAATRYGVPEEWRLRGVRRHGFHGASHKHVARRSAQLLGREDVSRRADRLYLDGPGAPVEPPALRVVSCHLGGSSSVTGNSATEWPSAPAWASAPSRDCPRTIAAGSRPLRAAAHDARGGMERGGGFPAALPPVGAQGHLGGIQRRPGPGARGGGGRSVGPGSARLPGPRDAPLDGQLALLLGGMDALVFTAGIGENRARIRSRICEGLQELGIVLDEQRNEEVLGREGEIGAGEGRVRILVIPANEEEVVAGEVRRYLERN